MSKIPLNESLESCFDWDSLQIKWGKYSHNEKGYLFEELVKAYLMLEPEYSSKLAHVWLFNELPQEIKTELKLPDRNQGIDIIAQTKSGEYWAVQCKYRQDSTDNITWSELSTFTELAFAACQNISFGLICSTTEHVTHVLKDADRIGLCAIDVWQNLTPEFMERLKAHANGEHAPLLPLEPRPHQEVAIDDGEYHFITKQEANGKLVIPCGGGKSLVAYWIQKKMESQHSLIAVPSLALIRQTLKVWLRETEANKEQIEWICVCSDESAGKVELDDNVVFKQDIGVPCITDAKVLAQWLDQNRNKKTVVFTTYQSGKVIADAAKEADFHFDFGVMDEAHKTAGLKTKKFGHLLHNENIQINQRMFMTATERHYQGTSETIQSMDNEEIYGKTFHLLSFKRALEFNPPILCDYKILSIAVSSREIAELIQQNALVNPDENIWEDGIEANGLAAIIALNKAMELYPIKHAVSFHSSIQKAQRFQKNYEGFSKSHGFSDLEAYHVSGKTPTSRRAQILRDFANAPRGLVTNSRCLTEGVDIPNIDCIVFADPRNSVVDTVQAAGRAMRPFPGKALGYIVIPSIIDENDAQESNFSGIIQTLRALAANDWRIIEYFKETHVGIKQRENSIIEFHCDDQIGEQVSLDHFKRNIDVKCLSKLASVSWVEIGEAKRFVHALKLQNHVEWRKYCKGELTGKPSKPENIPTAANKVYHNNGWTNWGDWLGTQTIASQLKEKKVPEFKGKAGTANGRAKLDNEKVAIIKNSPDATIKELAEHFDVSKGAIQDIRDGSNWKHVVPTATTPVFTPSISTQLLAARKEFRDEAQVGKILEDISDLNPENLANLALSPRGYQSLKALGVQQISDFAKITPRQLHTIWPQSQNFNQTIQELNKRGITLRMDPLPGECQPCDAPTWIQKQQESIHLGCLRQAPYEETPKKRSKKPARKPPGRPAKNPSAQGIFLNGNIYWLRYSLDKKQIRTSLDTYDFEEAKERANKLRGRPVILKTLDTKSFWGPNKTGKKVGAA